MEGDSINVRAAADPFEYSALTANNSEWQNNIAPVYVNNKTYNVASPDYETKFSVLTTTLNGTYAVPDEKPILTFKAVASDGSGSSTDGIDVKTEPEKGSVIIPPNFIGKIEVTVSFEKNTNPSREVNFTLNVDTLENTVKNTGSFTSVVTTPLGHTNYRSAKFFVDDVAWRVLSKNIGSGTNGHGTGSDYLIITEHAYALKDGFDASGKYVGVRWNNPDRWQYNGSYIQAELSKAYLSNFSWAHGVALRPFQDGSWTSTSGSRGAPTRSRPNTDPNLYVGDDGMDGCFLLSHNEVFARTYYGWPTSISQPAGGNRRAANLIGSKGESIPVALWLRSSRTIASADGIDTNGSDTVGYLRKIQLYRYGTMASGFTPAAFRIEANRPRMAVRPAMLLRFA